MSRFEPIVRSWSAISRSLPQFAPARRPHARRRPRLERLEDRTMLSSTPVALTVNMLKDDPSGPTTGQMTLRDAINTADGGAITNPTNQYVINFKSGLSGAINLTQSLPPLAANITIKGPGVSKLTVQRDSSATALFSVFTVDSGETVNLSGMTIAGGNASADQYTDPYSGGGLHNITAETMIDSGGGISNEIYAMLTVTNVKFADNYGIYGGGIGNAGTLIVTNSTFINNSAGNGAGIDTFGTITVNNSSFVGGDANGGGGIFGDIGVTMTVTNSVFIDNSAHTTGGGGMYNWNGSTTTVSNSIFIDNTSGGGGGIYNNGIFTVTNSIFINNTAINPPLFSNFSLPSGNGGAIYNGGGVWGFGNTAMTITDSVFINNSAIDNGGGIYNYTNAMITITDSLFADNSATNGGGIYNVGTLITTDNLFFHNTGGDIN